MSHLLSRCFVGSMRKYVGTFVTSVCVALSVFWLNVMCYFRLLSFALFLLHVVVVA